MKKVLSQGPIRSGGRIELAQGGLWYSTKSAISPGSAGEIAPSPATRNGAHRYRQTLKVDARVLAATNKDLQQAMRAAPFVKICTFGWPS
jgi:hypothetical protein